MEIVNATELQAGDVISISGEEEDAERVLTVVKQSGYSLVDDGTIRLLTDKRWMKVGRDSQVPVLRRAD